MGGYDFGAGDEEMLGPGCLRRSGADSIGEGTLAAKGSLAPAEIGWSIWGGGALAVGQLIIDAYS